MNCIKFYDCKRLIDYLSNALSKNSMSYSGKKVLRKILTTFEKSWYQNSPFLLLSGSLIGITCHIQLI